MATGTEYDTDHIVRNAGLYLLLPSAALVIVAVLIVGSEYLWPL